RSNATTFSSPWGSASATRGARTSSAGAPTAERAVAAAERVNEGEFLRGLRDRLAWPDLGPDTQLSGDERWDSLAQVDVVMYVQDELGHKRAADALHG